MKIGPELYNKYPPAPLTDKQILTNEGNTFIEAAILLLQESGRDALLPARALLDNAQEAYDFADECDC